MTIVGHVSNLDRASRPTDVNIDLWELLTPALGQTLTQKRSVSYSRIEDAAGSPASLPEELSTNPAVRAVKPLNKSMHLKQEHSVITPISDPSSRRIGSSLRRFGVSRTSCASFKKAKTMS